ncbi:MAG: hypothetical protein H7270_02440 [Dermatophilaceae bacterium]|nr:hypothetical protein [Dermatophilaceae bacterium]
MSIIDEGAGETATAMPLMGRNQDKSLVKRYSEAAAVMATVGANRRVHRRQKT